MKSSSFVLIFGVLTVHVASPTTLSPKCGGILQASSTPLYLQSPGYPVAYPNNSNCTWLIQATPVTAMIRIIVTDSQLQYDNFCDHDSVKVYNGPTARSRKINVWCGSMMPTLQSSGGNLTLVFKTDSNITTKGFNLTYFATSQHYHCGSNLTANNTPKTFMLPGYPHMYQNEARCSWLITAAAGQTIKVFVTDSEIEPHLFCRSDWAWVLDGPSLTSPKLGAFCGSKTPNYTSSGNTVLIHFHSDALVVYRGFKMIYVSGIFQECENQSVVAHGKSSDITSLGYPAYYQGPSEVDCTWTIDTNNENSVVSIVVETLDMVNCTTSYMEAFDGSTETSWSLGRWCGTNKPTAQSSGRYMLVKYHTSSSSPKARLKIKYSSNNSLTTKPSHVMLFAALCTLLLLSRQY